MNFKATRFSPSLKETQESLLAMGYFPQEKEKKQGIDWPMVFFIGYFAFIIIAVCVGLHNSI